MEIIIYIYPISQCFLYFLPCLHSLLYIQEVINKTFSQYSSLNFLSPVICIHLDRVCSLLSDPNNWYQSEARFTTICKDGNFNDWNWKFWWIQFQFLEMQIEDYLYQKDLHEPLLGVKPDTMTTEQWKLKDRQALGLIWLTLSRNVAFNIIKEKTTSDLLKALSNMC